MKQLIRPSNQMKNSFIATHKFFSSCLCASRLMWLLVISICGFLMPFNVASAQTGQLNDTGQTNCYTSAHAVTPCDLVSAGNGGARPHQDGRYGRDAAVSTTLIKIGGGAAGFDFSCVLWNGVVINGSDCTVGLVTNNTGTATTTPTTDWACTRDNTTGLVWSLQSRDPVVWLDAMAVNFPNPGHNSVNRCGYSNGWRVPTRRELLTIAHNGLAAGVATDNAYLPGTPPYAWYWSADPVSWEPALRAWLVGFEQETSAYPGVSGGTWPEGQHIHYYVRLVRGTP
jgi:Protein of unknown function (DUF1566)